MPGIGKYMLPLVMGSLQQLKSVSFGDNTDAQITLIARRSVQRPGVRHWRRGADAEVSSPPHRDRFMPPDLAMVAVAPIAWTSTCNHHATELVYTHRLWLVMLRL